MDTSLQGPNNQDDGVFFDAFHNCPFHHCSGDDDNSPEYSTAASCHDPRSLVIESPGTGSDSSSTNGATTSFKKDENHEIWKENETFSEKCDSNQEKVRSFQSPSVVTEERNEESTLTTAENEDVFSDSVELGDSPSNSLEYVTGLVIKAIGFQIKVFILLIKCPMLFLFHTCMFFMDPLGTIRKGKVFFMGVLDKVWFFVCGYIGPSTQGWLNEHKSLWNVAFRCGWGLLWSICVCFILFVLLVSSLVVSWFLVKGLVEKPFQMRQVLNFDYTKQSPVAFVPIISCAGVGGSGVQDSEDDFAVSRWMSNKRVIPGKQRVQVTVLLLVPESEYNTNLGVFQISVDFVSSDGKTIASLSQPCMLKFRSEPIRLIATFLKVAPLVAGYISETQTLNVKMRGFLEGDVPTSCLKVTLEQRAKYLPGAGIPQIYDSSIFIESELPLFKRIIWHWKIIIFMWIAMTAFMMELLFVLVCCCPIIIQRTRQRSSSAHGVRTQNNLQVPS